MSKESMKMMKGARRQLRTALDTMDTAIKLAEMLEEGDVMVSDRKRLPLAPYEIYSHTDAVLVLIDNAKQLTKAVTDVYLDIEKNRG